MKYKKYILTFSGDNKAALSLLRTQISREQDNLGRARALGRAAKLLFGVSYNVTSVTLPKPTAERVKSI